MSDNLIPAAVLIPLLAGPSLEDSSAPSYRLRTRTGELRLPTSTEVILTVRTMTVEHHKGQIAFPGGVVEPEDVSLEQAALRETHEEIGIEPTNIEIVAELPPVPTVSTRFTVHPFVGVIRERPNFSPNPNEIGEILVVPLEHLLNPKHANLETFERGDLRYKLKTYYFNSHRIWGATGIMLETLLEKFIEKG